MELRTKVKTGAAETKTKELVLTREFDVPRKKVFQAWTEPEHMKQWWGPKGFTCPACVIDLRVGGKVLSCMRSPEGKDFWSTGTYRELIIPEKIVVTDSFADEHGNIVSASHYGMKGDWPQELLITITLEEHDGQTTMTLRHSGLKDISDKDYTDMQQGWNESLDKLEAYLEK